MVLPATPGRLGDADCGNREPDGNPAHPAGRLPSSGGLERTWRLASHLPRRRPTTSSHRSGGVGAPAASTWCSCACGITRRPLMASTWSSTWAAPRPRRPTIHRKVLLALPRTGSAGAAGRKRSAGADLGHDNVDLARRVGPYTPAVVRRRSSGVGRAAETAPATAPRLDARRPSPLLLQPRALHAVGARGHAPLGRAHRRLRAAPDEYRFWYDEMELEPPAPCRRARQPDAVGDGGGGLDQDLGRAY